MRKPQMPPVLALTEAAQKQATERARDTKIDVQQLLAMNACPGCHAVDRKIVGPSFTEVAAKYTGTEEAAKPLAASIKSGGTGKWRAMAMPPMAGLSDVEALALAEYVLNQ
ncbi:c-type cytochrome [Congregibacter variabilis]|uniref:Cytochrome c-551 n=1 Tax=Congregibacter variabilis TaxID=3081200 RepID=A0ABZ0I0X2_9GAMM|nr:c-type cytochrome [Congregibacter sp. IMCC43200]